MKYKIIKLNIGPDEIVDIPDDCIPIEYNVKIVQTAGYGTQCVPQYVRELLILQPIKEGKGGEEQCSFCKDRMTKDKIGIRPICPMCLTIIYKMAKKSHGPYEC